MLSLQKVPLFASVQFLRHPTIAIELKKVRPLSDLEIFLDLKQSVMLVCFVSFLDKIRWKIKDIIKLAVDWSRYCQFMHIAINMIK